MIINLWKFILIILVLLFVLTNRLVYIKKDSVVFIKLTIKCFKNKMLT